MWLNMLCLEVGLFVIVLIGFLLQAVLIYRLSGGTDQKSVGFLRLVVFASRSKVRKLSPHIVEYTVLNHGA